MWDTPHLAAGSTAPQVNPNIVTVYNMRYITVQSIKLLHFGKQILSLCRADTAGASRQGNPIRGGKHQPQA